MMLFVSFFGLLKTADLELSQIWLRLTNEAIYQYINYTTLCYVLFRAHNALSRAHNPHIIVCLRAPHARAPENISNNTNSPNEFKESDA